MIDLVFFSLEKSLSKVFDYIKLHKKKESRNIHNSLLKKVIAILRSIFTTTLVQSNI